MMSKILCLLLAVMLSRASAGLTATACQYIVEESAVYNLFGLGTQNVTTPDDQTIFFKLCESNLLGCPINATTNSTIDVTAYVNPDSNGNCENIADTRLPVASFIDESDADSGAIFTYPAYTNGTVGNILIVTLTCDSSITLGAMNWSATVDDNSDGSVTYNIQGTGAPGCPIITLQRYLAFFKQYKYLFTAAFVIIGIFALIAGLQFFNVTIFVFTTLAVSAAIFVLIFGFAGLQTSIGVEWVVFVLCIIVGLGCGYGAIKLERVGFFALGALFGGFGALFLYSFLLHFFLFSEVVLYVIIGVLALAGGFLALWLWKDIIILATSCVGAYMLVRGCSFYIGGFPNEIAVAQGLETYNYATYAYLVVIGIVAILGIIYQFKKKKSAEENEKLLGEEDSVTKERLLR